MSIKKYLKRAIQYIVTGTPIYNIEAKIVHLAPNSFLENRVALITGGTSGIGFSIAKSFLESGASVIITGRTIERVNSSCEKLNKNNNYPGRIFGIVLDNSKIESFNNRFDQILALIGDKKIDILVNNAGVLGGEISNVTECEFDNILDTNLKGVFFLSKLVADYMIKNNIKGNILNIASSSSLRPAISAYAVSKWGLKGLTLGLAKVLTSHGITVNGIAPGPTATPMIYDESKQNLFFNNPLGRYLLPDEVANMAVFLTSNMGKSIVGDIIYMTGGSALLTFDDINYTF